MTAKTEHILSKIRSFVSEKNLLPLIPSPRIGIALSGGADSVALLLVAIDFGWHPIAMHCNFHLRGEESERDERFVDKLCQRLGVPLLKKDFDIVKLLSDVSNKGKSVEMICRDARYEWFREVHRSQTLTAVALGHHSDDNVETAILNSLRGCGLKGAKGMPHKRLFFIRPLLCISKKEVLELVEDAGESFVVDSTNLQNDFKRNQIRNLILPQIEHCFPGGTSRLTRTVENLADDYLLLSLLINEKRHRYIIDDGDILVNELFNHEHHCELLLFHLLDGRLDRRQIATMHNNLSNSGKIYELSDGTRMLLDRGVLKRYPAGSILSDNNASLTQYTSEHYFIKMTDIAGKLLQGICKAVTFPLPDKRGRILVTLLQREDFHPRRDPSYAWCSAIPLSNMKYLSIRRPKHADRMQPFGMEGTRLLSDIFTDAKLSRIDKEQQFVVAVHPTHGPEEIIWIPQVKNSALYPVTPSDSLILEFHIEYFK